MIKYLQQSQNKQSFCVVASKKEATHFQKNGGIVKAINQLVLNVPNRNVKESPLKMPSLLEPKESLDSDELKMPSLNFDDKKTSSKQEKVESGLDEPLEMPIL